MPNLNTHELCKSNPCRCERIHKPTLWTVERLDLYLGGQYEPEETLANKRYIVHAINSYQATIRAVRDIDSDLSFFTGSRQELLSRIKAMTAEALSKVDQRS